MSKTRRGTPPTAADEQTNLQQVPYQARLTPSDAAKTLCYWYSIVGESARLSLSYPYPRSQRLAFPSPPSPRKQISTTITRVSNTRTQLGSSGPVYYIPRMHEDPLLIPPSGEHFRGTGGAGGSPTPPSSPFYTLTNNGFDSLHTTNPNDSASAKTEAHLKASLL